MTSDSRQFESATLAEKLMFGPVAMILLVAARLGTLFLSTRRVVHLSKQIADLAADWSSHSREVADSDATTQPESLVRTLHLIQVSLQRASGFLPRARCLHRSVAARVWLASLGLRASVVVGVSRGARPDTATSDSEDSDAVRSSTPDRLESDRTDTRKFPADTGFHGHAWLEFDRSPPTHTRATDLPTAMFEHPDQDYTEVYRH